MTDIKQHLITLSYVLIPAFGMLLACMSLYRKTFNTGLPIIFQGLSTGSVLAVVIIKLIPDVFSKHHTLPVLIGLVIGIAFTLLVKFILERKIYALEQAENKDSLVAPIVFTLLVHILINAHALAIGLWFGKVEGLLLSLALSMETYALGIMLVQQFKAAGISARRCVAWLISLSLLFIITAATVFLTISHLSELVTKFLLPAGVGLLATKILLTEAPEGKAYRRQATFLIIGFAIFLIAASLIKN